MMYTLKRLKRIWISCSFFSLSLKPHGSHFHALSPNKKGALDITISFYLQLFWEIVLWCGINNKVGILFQPVQKRQALMPNTHSDNDTLSPHGASISRPWDFKWWK